MEISVTALTSSSAWQQARSRTLRCSSVMGRVSSETEDCTGTVCFPLFLAGKFEVNYRRLGRSGLKVSELSLGSWVTYGNQLDTSAARECMPAAWERGVNFFDNAEVYAAGKSEEIMGEALKKLAWPRLKVIVSTKFFWGITDGPNEKSTLNRKYLMNAIDASLKRLQMDYVDPVYCHRPDPATPLEETVWAMTDMIQRGKAR